MSNSFTIGYNQVFQNSDSELFRTESLNKELLFKTIIASSVLLFPIPTNAASHHLESNLKPVTYINKNNSHKLENIYDKITLENKTINRNGGIYMQYDERIENKIDNIQNDLTDHKIDIATIKKDIDSINESLNALPETIKNSIKENNKETKNNLWKFLNSPLITAIIIGVLSYLAYLLGLSQP